MFLGTWMSVTWLMQVSFMHAYSICSWHFIYAPLLRDLALLKKNWWKPRCNPSSPRQGDRKISPLPLCIILYTSTMSIHGSFSFSKRKRPRKVPQHFGCHVLYPLYGSHVCFERWAILILGDVKTFMKLHMVSLLDTLLSLAS